MARAFYADKRVYLLDDPFAALDRSVARFVYAHCVRSLVARDKLVLLCTHHEQFLREASLVVRLGAGGQTEQIGKMEAWEASRIIKSRWAKVPTKSLEIEPTNPRNFGYSKRYVMKNWTGIKV